MTCWWLGFYTLQKASGLVWELGDCPVQFAILALIRSEI